MATDLQPKLISQLVSSADAVGDTDVLIIDQAGQHKKILAKKFVEPETVLVGRDITSQQPTGLGVPLQVTFGDAQTEDDITLAGDGTMTIQTDGTYNFVVSLNLERSSAASIAILLVRGLVNGTQVGNPFAFRFDDDQNTVPFQFSFTGAFTSGNTVTIEIARDEAGVDNGGLESITATGALAAWGQSSSAAIRVNKFG